MNDKELADKVVALGIARKWKEGVTPGGYKIDGRSGSFWLDPHTFVRDWRVVGALMEKCEFLEIEQDFHMEEETLYWAVRVLVNDDFCASNESLPRAINEACVQALQGISG